MIVIYKIQKNGKAVNFQHAKKCPAGWKYINSCDIPNDISVYHEQKYISGLNLENQKQVCQAELDKWQYIVDGDCDYPQADIDAEKARRKKIKAIMRGTKIVKIPKRSF
jgi:hypothetical protein